MALLFFDTFQYGASVTDSGWDAGGAAPTYGPSGGPFSDRYVNTPNTMQKTLGVNATTLIFGYWFREPAGVILRNWDFKDGATVQCSITQDASGFLVLKNGTGGTTLLTLGPFSLNVWRFIELKIVFGNAGSIEARVDGTVVGSASPVDNTASANNYCNAIAAGNTGDNRHQFAHLYMLDTTGSAPTNNYLGPVKGYILSPTGADTGNYNQWAASVSTRTSCVDEMPTPNDDTDYISDNTAGHKSSFSMADTAAGLGTIFGAAAYYRARRDDAGPHTGRFFFRIAGTDYAAATETFAASYVSYAYLYPTSPATTAAWTTSEIDGLETGVELVT